MPHGTQSLSASVFLKISLTFVPNQVRRSPLFKRVRMMMWQIITTSSPPRKHGNKTCTGRTACAGGIVLLYMPSAVLHLARACISELLFCIKLVSGLVGRLSRASQPISSSPGHRASSHLSTALRGINKSLIATTGPEHLVPGPKIHNTTRSTSNNDWRLTAKAIGKLQSFSSNNRVCERSQLNRVHFFHENFFPRLYFFSFERQVKNSFFNSSRHNRFVISRSFSYLYAPGLYPFGLDRLGRLSLVLLFSVCLFLPVLSLSRVR